MWPPHFWKESSARSTSAQLNGNGSPTTVWDLQDAFHWDFGYRLLVRQPYLRATSKTASLVDWILPANVDSLPEKIQAYVAADDVTLAEFRNQQWHTALTTRLERPSAATERNRNRPVAASMHKEG